MKQIVSIVFLLLSFCPLQAGSLDFEDAASFGGDNAAIDASYFSSYGFGITAQAGNSAADAVDVTFAFESEGRDGTDGFWTRNEVGRDSAVSGHLGNYFMKAGTGDLAYNLSLIHI